jgi:hypothetical protein
MREVLRGEGAATEMRTHLKMERCGGQAERVSTALSPV